MKDVVSGLPKVGRIPLEHQVAILKDFVKKSLSCYNSHMLGNNYLLWEDDAFFVCTPFNPHLPYSEGPIVVIKPKADIANSWQEPNITGTAFKLSAKVCQVMEKLNMTQWFNLQANGNWGLLPDASPHFHIYIYGRNKTESWAKPIILPVAPKTYNNDPMPESDRNALANKLKYSLLAK